MAGRARERGQPGLERGEPPPHCRRSPLSYAAAAGAHPASWRPPRAPLPLSPPLGSAGLPTAQLCLQGNVGRAGRQGARMGAGAEARPVPLPQARLQPAAGTLRGPIW